MCLTMRGKAHKHKQLSFPLPLTRSMHRHVFDSKCWMHGNSLCPLVLTSFRGIPLYAGYIFTSKRWARDNLDHPPHIMSDHILLGAALMGGFACEAALGMLELR